jgi:hypothetical protein
MDEANGGQFLGLSWWTWTYTMTYPPMKWFDNVFLPPTPSSDVLAVIHEKQPLQAGGVKCIWKAFICI